MKKYFSLCLLLAILMTSCQTSSELGSTSLIQKRRYTKGYNLNIKKPVEAKSDQSISASNDKIDIDRSTFSNTEVLEEPNFKLKDDRATETEIASIELSEALLNNSLKSSSQNHSASVVPPTESQNAYPLSIENRRNRFGGSTAPVAAASGAEVTFLVILLTILLPPLGVALVFGISAEFWISLLLTLLFYFPGLIYSLIVIL